MEILIILIAWFAVGLVYFINVTASNVYKNLSDAGMVAICIIFLPTTIFLLIVSKIKDLYDYIVRFENDRANKRMQRSNKK